MKETKQDQSSLDSDKMNSNKKNYHCPKLEEYGTVTGMTLAVGLSMGPDGGSAGMNKVSL